MEGRRGRKIKKTVMKSSEDEEVHKAVKAKKEEEMIEEERWEEGRQEERKKEEREVGTYVRT